MADEGGTGLIIAGVGLVIAIVTGLTQLDAGRNLVCTYTSVLCKRANTVRVATIDYAPPAGPAIAGPISGWTALREAVGSLAPPHPDCIAANDFMAFRAGNPPWPWDIQQVDPGQPVALHGNRQLMFDFDSRYRTLVRDVTLSIAVTVDQATFRRPEFDSHYEIVLPEGSDETRVFCQLFFPGPGELDVHFAMSDDYYGSDDPITVPLKLVEGP
ncbi:hypothetical protein [Inquilinus sp.]|jgi:hypothetical protein|uniref:hypothetical protein n=1 Tax=Inquilinus sp. TaxID=1932117 RepID=UPI003783A509